PPYFPLVPITTPTVISSIEQAAQVSNEVSFQFAWWDPVTQTGTTVQDVTNLVNLARERGLRYIIQFNAYSPAFRPDGSGLPVFTLTNPVMPPLDPFNPDVVQPSFSMPELRAAYLEVIAGLAALQPDYLFLGPEVNFLAYFDPAEFQQF